MVVVVLVEAGTPLFFVKRGKDGRRRERGRRCTISQSRFTGIVRGGGDGSVGEVWGVRDLTGGGLIVSRQT